MSAHTETDAVTRTVRNVRRTGRAPERPVVAARRTPGWPSARRGPGRRHEGAGAAVKGFLRRFRRPVHIGWGGDYATGDLLFTSQWEPNPRGEIR